MAVELRHVVGADRATLYYYCSTSEMWNSREVDYSPPDDRPVRPWGGNGVISYNRSLWWIDLTQGLVRCDPFVENPRLVHVPLPPCCELATSAAPEVTKCRCIQVSRGKIRFVQLEGDTNSTVIKSWTLQAGQQPGIIRWKPGFEIPILQVWAYEILGVAN
ncbi:hypothetical protein GUJ93_ZPchr0005g14963 [Zizania palustris]|uniref:DUF1618 domain-containing protein n=1 Tax=Zizania palustris TaxID=103762 RepID=A0A8J5S577_ZIZPA|nr:hypothetical protein GUJ93_ZPchr0005g14963 [Zizania palustris]